MVGITNMKELKFCANCSVSLEDFTAKCTVCLNLFFCLNVGCAILFAVNLCISLH